MLVADSEASSQPLYQQVAAELSYALEFCAQGSQVVLGLIRRSYDLVIFDPCAEGLNPIKLLVYLQRQPSPPAVLVIGKDLDHDIAEAVAQSGMPGLLSKPCSAGELRAAIEALLRERAHTLAASVRLLSGGPLRLAADEELRCLYRQIARSVLVRFQADRVSLMLWNDGSDRVIVAASVGFPFVTPGETSAQLHDSVSGWVVRHMEPLLLDPDGDVPFDMQSNWRNSALCSGICVPLAIRGRVLGVLTAARRCDRPIYTNSDLDLLMSMTLQVSALLESSQLQQQQQRRTQALARLHALGNTLLAAADYAAVVRIAVDHLREVFPNMRGYAFLRASESPGIDEIVVFTPGMTPPPDLDDLRDDPGLVGQVLADGVPRLHHNASQYELADWERPLADQGEQSLLCVALKSDTAVYGAIELMGRVSTLGEEELQYLVAVAGLLAPAIEKAQQAALLMRLKLRYDAMFQHAANAILLVDMRSKAIVLANPAAERLSGYSQIELASIAPARLIAAGPSGRTTATIGDLLAGRVPEYEGYVRSRSGYHVPAQISTSTLTHAGEPYLLLIIRNNADGQREAQRLAQKEKLAGMTRLTAAIAHEVNNPLQALNNTLHLLLHRSYTDEKRERLLSMAHMEVDRLAAIVRRMLDLHRPAIDDMRPLSVHSLIDSALATAAPQLQQHHVLVDREWHEQLPRVVGIGGHLKQVFYDLVINAVEAMPNGGRLIIRTQLDLTADQPARVLIEFIDSGPGISDSEAQLIFDPFYTTKHANPGLGLAVGYGIVERHGGVLSVSSGAGGSTFRVVLPAASTLNG